MALVPTNEMPLTKMVRGAWAPAEQARHTHLANDNARHMQDMNNTLDRQAMEQSLVIQSADKDATERHQQKVEGERMLATTYLQVHHDNDMAKQHAAEEQKSDAQQQFKIEQEKWMVEIIERFAQQDQDRQRKEEANEAEVKRIRAQQEEAKAAAKIWAQATRRDKVAREEQETNAARAAADQSTQNANTRKLMNVNSIR
jgi:hypothetical protein